MQGKLLGLLLFAVPLTAFGSQVAQQYGIDELVAESTRVVRGIVRRIDSERSPDGRIMSRVQLDVERTVPFSSSRTVDFVVSGGEIDGVSMSVAGSPQPRVGEELLVFLRGDRLVGQGQGLYVGRADQWVRPEFRGNEAARVHRVEDVMGDASTARSCVGESIDVGHEAGWSPRGSVPSTLRAGKTRAIAVQLIQGLDYRLSICTDGQAGMLDGAVYDPAGRLVDSGRSVSGLEWSFRAEETGEYLVAMEADAFPEDVQRTAVALLLAYR